MTMTTDTPQVVPQVIASSQEDGLHALVDWLRFQAESDPTVAAKLKELQTQSQYASDPNAWAQAYATIITPTEGRIPFRPYPYQTRLLQDTSPRRLVLKSRQTGISNTIAIEALHKAITRPDSTELFVSRSQDAARVLIRYCQHTLAGLTNAPTLVNENQSELAFSNGSRILSLPATPATGRGFAATDAYLDEFAFAAYDSLIYESIMGTLSTGGRLTIFSTPNGRTNMFFRLWSGLEGGTWSRHSIHWSDCPRFTPEWAEQMRASMTRASFAQEYDLDFIHSGDVVFEPEDLAECKKDYDPTPETCEALITAWDIGRRQDHTVGITIGLRNNIWHVIELTRFLAPYPVIQSRIDDRKRKYGATWVESNGVGDPVIENLSERVEPFYTTLKTKTQAIEALQMLIQNRRFKHDNEQLDRELSLYSWDDRDLIQDCVMAAAIAAYEGENKVVHRRGWGSV